MIQIDKQNENEMSKQVKEKWQNKSVQTLKNSKWRERKRRSKRGTQNHPVQNDSKNGMKSSVAWTNLRKISWNSRKNFEEN